MKEKEIFFHGINSEKEKFMSNKLNLKKIQKKMIFGAKERNEYTQEVVEKNKAVTYES